MSGTKDITIVLAQAGRSVLVLAAEETIGRGARFLISLLASFASLTGERTLPSSASHECTPKPVFKC
jgi:hypothetical protein